MNPLILILLVILISFASRADISEPDNLLYGTLVLDNQIITAARTDIVIEARRSQGGVPIASYRMGADPRLGSFYRLRLNLEAAPPVTHTNTSRLGDSVFIVVRDASGIRGQTSFTFPERGNVQRVDFGAPVTDSDGNGLPDAWEIAHFGGIGQNPNPLIRSRPCSDINTLQLRSQAPSCSRHSRLPSSPCASPSVKPVLSSLTPSAG